MDVAMAPVRLSDKEAAECLLALAAEKEKIDRGGAACGKGRGVGWRLGE